MESEIVALLRCLVEALVDEAGAVAVSEEIKQAKGKDDKEFTATVFTVAVSQRDTGKIIGKGGETADALRVILRAVGGKQHKAFLLNVKDHRPAKGGN